MKFVTFLKNVLNKRSKETLVPSIFEEDDFPYSISELEVHNSMYQSLNEEQKLSFYCVIDFFRRCFIPSDSIQGKQASELLVVLVRFLGINPVIAESKFSSPESLMSVLKTIDNPEVLQVLLNIIKYLLRQVVALSMLYRDGAEVNRKAVNFMYGLFMPLGFSEKQIYSPRDYMMF